MSFILPYSFIFIFSVLPMLLWSEKIFKSSQGFSAADRFFISLLLAPACVSTLLFYLLWLLPKQKPIFYPGMIVVIGLIGIISRLYRSKVRPTLNMQTSIYKIKSIIIPGNLPPLGLISFLLFISIIQIASGEVNDHDWFEYGTLGKVLFQKKQILFQKVKYFKETGFYFIGLHGYTVPLFKTMEEFINAIIGARDDFFFRTISYYYNILLFTWICLKLLKINVWASTLYLLLMIINIKAFSTIFSICSIDPVRLSLLYIFLYTIYRLQKSNEFTTYLLLGFLAGIAAFVHSLSMIITSLAIGVIVLVDLYKQPRGNKLIQAGVLILVFLLSGGIYYLMETLSGTGWIFQEINYY